MISYHLSARADISLITSVTVFVGMVKMIDPGISSSTIGAFIDDIMASNSSFVVFPGMNKRISDQIDTHVQLLRICRLSIIFVDQFANNLS